MRELNSCNINVMTEYLKEINCHRYTTEDKTKHSWV